MNPLVLRILVVDDHPLVRDGLRAGIRARFPTAVVAEAGGAPEALASISIHPPDLVLLDVNLPGENGINLARRIRAADKSAKLLMVAGDADPWTVKEAIQAGASGFVTKIRCADFLGQAMTAVLEGRLFICPEAQAALQRAEEGRTELEPPGPAYLSNREQEVLRYIAHGENTKNIGSLLQISPKTVETHRQHIMQKLGLKSVAQLTRYAIRHRLTSP